MYSSTARRLPSALLARAIPLTLLTRQGPQETATEVWKVLKHMKEPFSLEQAIHFQSLSQIDCPRSFPVPAPSEGNCLSLPLRISSKTLRRKVVMGRAPHSALDPSFPAPHDVERLSDSSKALISARTAHFPFQLTFLF